MLYVRKRILLVQRAIQTLKNILLSDRGPFVSFRNEEGEERFHEQTPLHVAARGGYFELVQLFVNSKSEIDARKKDD